MRYTELLRFLRGEHYSEVAPVHQSGDFCVQGDMITVWLVTDVQPTRWHFFDEELEKVEMQLGEGWKKTEPSPELLKNEIPTQHGTIYPGEYVVHPHHGVGIFEHIATRLNQEKQPVTYVSLQYAGNDRLLFPRERQAELMPYIGSRHPRLTRLYSKSWQNLKEKVQKDLIGIARELLQMYAERQLTKRVKYSINNDWQQVLANQVDFDLTEDQTRALKDIEHDLTKSPHPMDRLLCGDVGFGKTEVALRAAAHVLANGKQVALVAPTTVLTEQHFTVLSARLADLPVNTEHVSRLTSNRQKEIAEGLASGKIDFVVGTHGLLNPGIEFSNLGLLIIDEEQKFGVAQKERLKEVRAHLDVLSLSATPIPRTLSMSLSGLRGLSILRTPPHGRLPIDTKVEKYSDSVVQHAIIRELDRSGQVYLVHNRVQSLAAVGQRVLRVLERAGKTVELFVPGQIIQKEGVIRVAIAHGQMPEVKLAQTMSAFLKGDIDILVASSIVEHGLDSARANTLIVLHSEWFGLSDLYQLRGRVGRRKKQAYAHFLLGGVEHEAYEGSEELLAVSDTAKRRLQALQEADELGSGWSIALRDLEIRGGGNVLGHEQHGNLEAIGLLLYSQLLQEEIGRQALVLGIPIVQNQSNSD